MSGEQSQQATVASDTTGSLYGLLAEYENPALVMQAAERVRDAGYTRWDVHTPFPVHGMDDAMGIQMTKLPLIIFGGGLAGCAVGVLMQWWMNAVDYPYVVSGKPFFSLPAFIPIMFELTILFSALTAFFGMFVFNNLPELYHAVFRSTRFKRATDDRFYISIEAEDPRFDALATRTLLVQSGGTVEELVEE